MSIIVHYFPNSLENKIIGSCNLVSYSNSVNHFNQPYHIFPLGDSAFVIDFGNKIADSLNEQVLAVYELLQKNPLPGMIESVPAYSSLTVHYDFKKLVGIVPYKSTVYDWMANELRQRIVTPIKYSSKEKRLIKIPVCYDEEFAPDLNHIAKIKDLSKDEIVQLHCTKKYKVYMLGFLPGFPYLGIVDERLKMPRKNQPVPIAAGSVGIAAEQTGIYPLASPGGWQIIGRTPLKMFHPENEVPVLLKAGDIVEFYAINKEEFYSQKWQ